MALEIWKKNMKEAAAGDRGPGFPSGTLQGPSLRTQKDVKIYEWTFRLEKNPSTDIRIEITRLKRPIDAAELYGERKGERKQEEGKWEDWPEGLPDHGNDYEHVEFCGMQIGAGKGFAMWTQDEEKFSFLVTISCAKEIPDLGNYGDGIWLTVYESAKGEVPDTASDKE